MDPVHAVLRYLCELGDEEGRPLLDRILAYEGAETPRNMAHRPALDNLAVATARLGRAELAGTLYDSLSSDGETFGHGTVAYHCEHYYLGPISA